MDELFEDVFIGYYGVETYAFELKKENPTWSIAEIAQAVYDNTMELFDQDWEGYITNHIEEVLQKASEKKIKKEKV